jgi:ribosome biogenesis GTPase
MRELGMTDNMQGITATFQEIYSLSLNCKFPACLHIDETECAVLEALNKGIIDNDSLENFTKLRREPERFQTTVAERHKKISSDQNTDIKEKNR